MVESLRIMIGSVGIFEVNLSFESASGLRDIKTVECRRPTLLVLDFTPARNPWVAFHWRFVTCMMLGYSVTHWLVFTDLGVCLFVKGLGRRIDVWHGNTPALYLSQKESNLITPIAYFVPHEPVDRSVTTSITT